MKADLLLYNGRVYTMTDTLPHAQAVAIAGNRIVAVGSDDELRPLLRPGGRAVDLGGRTAIPGMVDAHTHFGWYSYAVHQGYVDLDNVPTLQQAVEQVAAAARQAAPGRWIRGGGWNKNVWPDAPAGRGFPTAADLDAVAPDHPVLLQDKSHHAAWANTRALAAAGITAGTDDPAGGEIVRDEAGQPTGMLLETAVELVQGAVPPPTVEDMVEALRHGITVAHSLGLTGVHDPGDATVLAAFQVLHAAGELDLRALMLIPTEQMEAAIALGLRSGLGDDRLRIGGVKLFADGALGPQTAHMLAPYEGSAQNLGIPTHSQAALDDMVVRAHAAGLSVAIHAIGDAANRAALDAIEKSARRAQQASRPAQPPALPDRIEHVQLFHPDDVGRLAALGVVASMQPIHATSDMDMAQHNWGDRCALAYAWRSVLDSGAALIFGSDCPIETLDPLAGIHAAVTRRRADGRPGSSGWVPAQRLAVGEAVRAYTIGPARAEARSDVRGSLAAGKFADLAILSHDLWDLEPMALLDAQVDMTVFDGRIVYER